MFINNNNNNNNNNKLTGSLRNTRRSLPFHSVENYHLHLRAGILK